jgi:predicted O-linked N-acetylglucosamine transferase (SPINDLY family)
MLNAVPSNGFDPLMRAAVQAFDAGRLADAAAVCRQALSLKPSDPSALFLQGEIHQRSGRLPEAIDAFTQSAAAAPGVALPLVRLAQALLDARRFEEALGAARRALALAPGNVQALNIVGLSCLGLNRPAEAVGPLREVARQFPDQAEVRSNLGLALTACGEAETAVAVLEEAVRLAPGNADALTNLGLALLHSRRPAAAIRVFKRAAPLCPENLAAWVNWSLAATAAGDIAEAIHAARRTVAIAPASAEMHSGLLLTLHYDPSLSPGAIFEEHRRWSAKHAAAVAPLPPMAGDCSAGRKLRVGYVSPDFRRHPVAQFITPLLEAHDRTQVEVVCFATAAAEDEVTRRMQALPVGWRNIASLGDREAAAAVRAEGIDVLVDLAGHTAGNRLPLFAYRPAAVQVTYLGYPNTTGMAAMDWRLTDGVADPAGGGDGFCSERLWRLERGFLCYAPDADAPAVAELPARRAGQVTFGSFNMLGKINGAVLDLWARVLAAVGGSRMLLKAAGLSEEETRERLWREFEGRGVERGRVLLRGYAASAAEHFAAYHEVDVGLDTFPYNGATTTCDALWMGTPVVTLAGASHVARVGASILTAAGLGEWITRTPEEFVEIAARGAADVEGLARLRAGLRQQVAASALADKAGMARAVEAAYREMWRRQAAAM